MPAFLAKAKDAYIKLCPHHKDIFTDAKVREDIYTNCSEDIDNVFEAWIDENFDFTGKKEDYVEQPKLREHFQEHFGSNRMTKLLGQVKFKEFTPIFESIAVKRLRDAGYSIRQYKVKQPYIETPDGRKRERVYKFVKYIGNEAYV
jgi:hypothetical protein